MATVSDILTFAVAMMVFFYPLAAMFSFYGDDGLYRFRKNKFIFISSVLTVLAFVSASVLVFSIPEASAQNTVVADAAQVSSQQ
jgi:NADH:ubiquinone oxidoreductase subunit 6 (subunit J)